MIVFNLEMLMRSVSIRLKCDGRKVNLLVPHLYQLNLNSPIDYDMGNTRAKFDCTTRILSLFLPLKGLILTQHIISDENVEEIQPIKILDIPQIDDNPLLFKLIS